MKWFIGGFIVTLASLIIFNSCLERTVDKT